METFFKNVGVAVLDGWLALECALVGVRVGLAKFCWHIVGNL